MSSKKSGKKSKGASEAKATEPKAAKPTESKPAKQQMAKAAATAPKRARAPKPATAKPAAAKPAAPGKVSALDAAAQVLQRKGEPMRSGELISAMAESGLWESPKGKTPHATLYAAILREISVKGRDARFRKVDRGRFEYAKGA